MKKALTLFLFSAIMLNFASCGSSGNQPSVESTTLPGVESVSESTEKSKPTRRKADFESYVFRIMTRDDKNTTT